VSSEAKNLEVISRAIDQHNTTCEWPAVAVLMNPFEVDRLGWDTIRGLPIRPDPAIGTGAFRIQCAKDEGVDQEEEVVEAVSSTDREIEIVR
jgi:hypothetical protein